MRYPSALLAVALSCSPTVDTRDPHAVALAVLASIKSKDLDRVAELSMSDVRRYWKESAALKPDDPEYAILYSGDMWDSIQSWDGRLKSYRFNANPSNTYKTIDFEYARTANFLRYIQIGREGAEWKFSTLQLTTLSEWNAIGKGGPAYTGLPKELRD
jgi:hypothetical protein